VKTAGDRGDQIVVQDGLLGGEALVVGDATELSEGAKVEVTSGT
jgi:hypothetical protein